LFFKLKTYSRKQRFSKLRPQTLSIGLSDNWSNQCRESLLPLTSWWHFRTNLQKTFFVFLMRSRRRRRRDNFSVTRFFVKLITLIKWGRRKRIQTLERLGEEEEWTKVTVLRNNCAWIIFQRVSKSPTIRRYRIHRSLCQYPCYCCQVSEFFLEPFFSLTSIFLARLNYTIAIVSSAWRTFASLLKRNGKRIFIESEGSSKSCGRLLNRDSFRWSVIKYAQFVHSWSWLQNRNSISNNGAVYCTGSLYLVNHWVL